MLLFGCFLSIPLDSLIQQYLVHYYENADQSKSNATNATVGNRTLDECGHAVLSDISPQSLAAEFMAYMSIVNIVPSLLSTWFLVSSSDKLGRKAAIISPLIGLMLKGTIYALVIGTGSNIYWLTAAQLVYGISGGLITLLSGCMTYVVDTTLPDERLFRITVVELMSFLTLSVSFIGLGYLIKFLGYTLPCVISAIGLGVTIAYTVFFVPETVRRDFNSSICALEHFYKPLTVFYQPHVKKINWKLVALLFAILPATFGGMEMYVQVLYLMHYPICWQSVSIGYFQAASLATITIGTLLTVKLLKRCVPDNAIALLAGLSCIFSTGYNAFCYTETMLYFGMFVKTVLHFCPCMFCFIVQSKTSNVSYTWINDSISYIVFTYTRYNHPMKV